MKYYLTIISLLLGSLAYGQPAGAAKDVTIGFEADALPYITGGYYGSVWAGHNHVRYRAIISRINIPGFIIKSGFENNRIDAYAALADYFFKPALKGWWIGGGVEYWKGEIQTNAKIQTARYDNGIFTLGTGYIWRFYKNFYLNPWVAGHIRVAGDTKLIVDNKEFQPSLFTPECSLKLGWHF